MLGCFRRAASRNALVVAAAALLATPAAAHIGATPAFLPAGGSETISLAGHNDRQVAMNELTVRAPAGFTITDALEVEGWEASYDDLVATWTGGRLAGNGGETFAIDLSAPDVPGAATLEIEQRYPDGGVVRSPVTLTVVPGGSASSDRTWIVVVGVLGLLLLGTAGFVAAARRR